MIISFFTESVKFNTTEKCGGQIVVNYRNKWEKVCLLGFPSQFQEKLCRLLGCDGHNGNIEITNNNDVVNLCITLMGVCLFVSDPSLTRLLYSLTGIFFRFTWLYVVFIIHLALIFSCEPNLCCMSAWKDITLKTSLHLNVKVILETTLECTADHKDIKHCVSQKPCGPAKPAEIYCNGKRLHEAFPKISIWLFGRVLSITVTYLI